MYGRTQVVPGSHALAGRAFRGGGILHTSRETGPDRWEIHMQSERPVCPTCNTRAEVRRVRTLANLLRVLGNGLYIYSIRTPHGLPRRVFTVLYKCKSCRRCFTEAESRRQNRLCNCCEYDLTGNQSGRCPECGNPIASENQARSAVHSSVSEGEVSKRESD